MLSPCRASIAVAVVGAWLSSPAPHRAGAADQADMPVPVEELKKGLMGALGDSFECLGGEVGRTKAEMGYASAEWFWFAKVRPKTAGEFAVSYSIKFEFPDDAKKNWQPPERAVCIIPIKIGERGAPRVMLPHSTWGGSTYPHANVGDTLLMPICVDRFRQGHAFTTVDRYDRHVAAFFSVAGGDRCHEKYMKRASTNPVVRNDAPDRLELLASWGSSAVNRPLTVMHHSLTAYLEFKQSGEFNLAGRLADANDNAADSGTPIRVVPKDQPVTVVLEHADYRQHTGKFTSGSSGHVPGGTIEARVGDRVVLGCGGYRTPAKEKQAAYRPGVVVAKPFKPVEPYIPEPKK